MILPTSGAEMFWDYVAPPSEDETAAIESGDKE
jgi:hypothetical protein